MPRAATVEIISNLFIRAPRFLKRVQIVAAFAATALQLCAAFYAALLRPAKSAPKPAHRPIKVVLGIRPPRPTSPGTVRRSRIETEYPLPLVVHVDEKSAPA